MEGNGGVNAFANDGSFMEMFRMKMEEERRPQTEGKDSRKPAGETNMTTTRDESGSLVSSKTQPNARTISSCGNGQQPELEQLHEKLTEETVGRESSTSSTKAAKDLSKTGNATESDTKTKSMKSKSHQTSEEQSEQTTTNVDKMPTCTSQAPIPKKYSVLSHVGKRRDGKLSLKTGAVKKPKTQETGDNDACSKYMAEVQKYKAHVCGDEDKSRPLVK